MNKDKIKIWFSYIAFITSILFGVAAMIIPPMGIIDPSVLWFIAQMLVFAATMVGVPLEIDNLRQKIVNNFNNNKNE